MDVLLHPTYFPNIATFAVIAQRGVVWEAHDNFQKQTFRNRCHIATDKGRHALLIPIKHRGGREGRQKYAEVAMDQSYRWKKLHWRTLETAYRTSPFFEYYEEEIKPVFHGEGSSLYEFNLEGIAVVARCLGIACPMAKTTTFAIQCPEYLDARFLAMAKRQRPMALEPYAQVFGDRHDHIPNLSILDLLFNLGPRAVDYLKDQQLDFLDD